MGINKENIKKSEMAVPKNCLINGKNDLCIEDLKSTIKKKSVSEIKRYKYH